MLIVFTHFLQAGLLCCSSYFFCCSWFASAMHPWTRAICLCIFSYNWTSKQYLLHYRPIIIYIKWCVLLLQLFSLSECNVQTIDYPVLPVWLPVYNGAHVSSFAPTSNSA